MKLSAKNLVQGYAGKTILDGIDIEAESGQLVTILGPNGCGKSTLIRTLCGIRKPMYGAVEIDGTDIFSISKKELAKKISYVPQSFTMDRYTTVYDTVLLGRRPYIEWNYSKEDVAIAAEAMVSMKVDRYIDSFVGDLSGGQAQRVIIARSLTQDPEFFIFDEPTSSFDLRNQLDLMRIMKRIIREKNSCLVVAMHDLNLAMRYSDKVIVLKGGHVYDQGSPEKVITSKMVLDVYGVESEIIEGEHGLYVHSFDNDGDDMYDV